MELFKKKSNRTYKSYGQNTSDNKFFNDINDKSLNRGFVESILLFYHEIAVIRKRYRKDRFKYHINKNQKYIADILIKSEKTIYFGVNIENID